MGEGEAPEQSGASSFSGLSSLPMRFWARLSYKIWYSTLTRFSARPYTRASRIIGGLPVNKHDLIAAVAASTNLSKTDAAGAIEAMLTVITKSLKKKEKVLLVGFGTFQVSRRKAGEGRNPQTGEKIKIPAANVPRFKASKQLKDAIN
jgi:DNA-binding protein HU-beta